MYKMDQHRTRAKHMTQAKNKIDGQKNIKLNHYLVDLVKKVIVYLKCREDLRIEFRFVLRL